MASYYVDPSINANSGAGTVGDPYGDLQHCLDTISQGTSGDRINIKAGTAEVLTAAIDLSTYGTTSHLKPVLFVGYTSAEGDGGVAEIDGDGSYSIFDSSTLEGIQFRYLTLGNSGSNRVLGLDRFSGVHFCKIHTTTSDGVYSHLQTNVSVTNTWFDNIGGVGTNRVSGVHDCLFTNGTNTFSDAVSLPGSRLSFVNRCCFKLSGTSNAIKGISTAWTLITNNSLYTTGTGDGIDVRSVYAEGIQGNLIQGFATGVDGMTSGETEPGVLTLNAFYDCTTDTTNFEYSFNNESLSANMFDLSGSISSFADRLTYFNPVDQGDVYTALPGGLVKGAVQPASSGGGSVPYNPFATPYQFGART